MTRHRTIAVGIGLIMGALTGTGFAVVLAQREWDTSPLLGRNQPAIGGVIMGILVALLFVFARLAPITPDSK